MGALALVQLRMDEPYMTLVRVVWVSIGVIACVAWGQHMLRCHGHATCEPSGAGICADSTRISGSPPTTANQSVVVNAHGQSIITTNHGLPQPCSREALHIATGLITDTSCCSFTLNCEPLPKVWQNSTGPRRYVCSCKPSGLMQTMWSHL